MGIVSALQPHVPHWFGHVAARLRRPHRRARAARRRRRRRSPASAGSRTRSASTASCPRVFGRLHRRTLVSPESVDRGARDRDRAARRHVVSRDAVAVPREPLQLRRAARVHRRAARGDPAARTKPGAAAAVPRAAQRAHPRRRRAAPVGRRGALHGRGLRRSRWSTHAGARYGGPVWLLAASSSTCSSAAARGAGLLEHVVSADEQRAAAEATFARILVPMKLGEIGEEMVATAVRLAQERRRDGRGALRDQGAARQAARRAALRRSRSRRPRRSPRRARSAPTTASRSTGRTVRARAIGDAIVEAADESGADLIVLGSSPRWRRQSRFFSPTVDYVLRKAPAEVLIVAFPQGVARGADSALRCECGMKALVIGCGRVGSTIALQLQQRRLGRDGRRRERGRALAPRRATGRARSSSATAWTPTCFARRASRTPTRSSSRPTATTRTSSSARSPRSASASSASSCACSTRRAPTSTRPAGCARSARRRPRSTRSMRGRAQPASVPQRVEVR